MLWHQSRRRRLWNIEGRIPSVSPLSLLLNGLTLLVRQSFVVVVVVVVCMCIGSTRRRGKGWQSPLGSVTKLSALLRFKSVGHRERENFQREVEETAPFFGDARVLEVST